MFQVHVQYTQNVFVEGFWNIMDFLNVVISN